MNDDRRDALRYRFLRKAPDAWMVLRWLPYPAPGNDLQEMLDGEHLDAAIDAAMTTKPVGGGAAQEGKCDGRAGKRCAIYCTNGVCYCGEPETKK